MLNLTVMEEYLDLCQKAIDALKEAQRNLQAAQRNIGTAKGFNVLNGGERKLLDRTKVNLVDPIESIQTVINTIRIQLR